jgi:hypothetical protein
MFADKDFPDKIICSINESSTIWDFTKMKHITCYLLSCLIIGMAGCESLSPSRKTKEEIYENNAIPIGGKLSAASKRAIERNYDQGPEWFCGFRKHDLKGDFKYEEGVIRRDPSAVILVDDTYYVWYTKGEGKTYGFGTGNPSKKVFPWDLTEVWYATSKDGWDWKEQGLAVGRGPQGAYDDRAVFTPEVLAHEGKYYLVYQVVKAPYVNRVKNNVGMAIADSPDGPWKKLDAPILKPADNGQWLGDEDNRFKLRQSQSARSHADVLQKQVLPLLQRRAHGRAHHIRRKRDKMGRCNRRQVRGPLR